MKKIIAFIAAFVLLVYLFAVSFSVSADDEPIMTNQEYYAAQSYLIAKYKDGDISYGEFQERTQAVTDEFVTNNTIGGVLQSRALNAKNTFTAVSEKIGATFQKYGDAGREYVNEYVSDFMNDYTVLNDKPTTDLQGGNAILEVVFGTGSDAQRRKYYLNDYGLKLVNFDGAISYKMRSNTLVRMSLSQNGKTSEYTYDSSNAEISYSLSNANVSAIRIYGDWRSDDDTPVETDDTYETVSDYDFSEVPEKELEDLLKKILDEMEIKEPDLSTMEGLLRAIYARLGTLDSDNDNALLSSINSAILALVKSNDESNEELLKELVKFREDLKNGTVGVDTTSHGHEISGTLYNVIPLDKNWLNRIFHDKENLKVQYEGKTYYLEECGCLKLDDKFYNVDMNYDSYALSDYDFSNDDIEIDNKYVNVDFNNYNTMFANLSTSQRKKVNSIVDLIYKMVTQAIPYGAITSAFAPFEVIIFNTATPEDIVLEFEATENFSGFSATILSVSFFQNPYVSQAMDIVKPLLTVIIGYFWLKAMRKKAVSMLG